MSRSTPPVLDRDPPVSVVYVVFVVYCCTSSVVPLRKFFVYNIPTRCLFVWFVLLMVIGVKVGLGDLESGSKKSKASAIFPRLLHRLRLNLSPSTTSGQPSFLLRTVGWLALLHPPSLKPIRDAQTLTLMVSNACRGVLRSVRQPCVTSGCIVTSAVGDVLPQVVVG
ncbi:hypothetical protein BDM02DRAFT_841601 [Thelephora ganbajun]|uniref:Uncharacterized protein n=1 Tax=Thelephora ganbajun TaxID=370292 RepID=A0ACB6Z6A1_THEGA|nr:hypothetical protein BDM02DRAFT_841601 [Thelephora ganbajun]